MRLGADDLAPLVLFPPGGLRRDVGYAVAPDFSGFGLAPGMTDEGDAVAFMAADSDGLVGIRLVKLGDLDPPVIERVITIANDEHFLAFSSWDRTAVRRLSTERARYGVTFVAEPRDRPGSLGLYVSAVELLPSAASISAACKVVATGDRIPGVPGVVEDVRVYDPLAGPYVVAWVQSQGAQAIVRWRRFRPIERCRDPVAPPDEPPDLGNCTSAEAPPGIPFSTELTAGNIEVPVPFIGTLEASLSAGGNQSASTDVCRRSGSIEGELSANLQHPSIGPGLEATMTMTYERSCRWDAECRQPPVAVCNLASQCCEESVQGSRSAAATYGFKRKRGGFDLSLQCGLGLETRARSSRFVGGADCSGGCLEFGSEIFGQCEGRATLCTRSLHTALGCRQCRDSRGRLSGGNCCDCTFGDPPGASATARASASLTWRYGCSPDVLGCGCFTVQLSPLRVWHWSIATPPRRWCNGSDRVLCNE